MKPLQLIEALKRVAQRTVWFKIARSSGPRSGAFHRPCPDLRHSRGCADLAAAGLRRRVGRSDLQRLAGGVRRPFMDLLEPQDRAVSCSAAAGE